MAPKVVKQCCVDRYIGSKSVRMIWQEAVLYHPDFSLDILEETTKTCFWIADVSLRIQTENLPNASLGRYRPANRFAP
jgi:hypothetical protein